MELDIIKSEILKVHKDWNAIEDSPETIDNIKDAEILESRVRNLITNYCESKGYEVDGYPFQKRILGETDENYDEDYFCYERNLKYLDVLASTHDDVFDVMYLYNKTFWPNQIGTKEAYKTELIWNIQQNIYDIEF